MNNKKTASRRNFIRQSSLGLSAGIVGMSFPSSTTANPSSSKDHDKENKKLSKEICVAGIDLKSYLPPDTTTESRLKRILERMEEVTAMQPDIICLPELFATGGVEEQKPLSVIAEDEKVPGPVTARIAAFAKKNSCYVVCPVITKNEGNFYNSSLLVDRKGSIAGVYHKMHPVKTEIFPNQDFIGGGVVPGAIDQPVIETDFGKVGMQICYDANWADGWDNLKKKGADIVLFPSAFPGGRMLNYYALQNGYYIISGTNGEARVIDISGNDLDCTSDFVRYAWATINLDKVNVDIWPTNRLIPELLKKYGSRIGIRVWTNTDIITMESRDPKLKILSVLKEFDIPVLSDYLKSETDIQDKYRSVNSKI
ncbi:MAG: carbon-nitrogen hydrolase family protein [Ferruginibacter sp.]